MPTTQKRELCMTKRAQTNEHGIQNDKKKPKSRLTGKKRVPSNIKQLLCTLHQKAKDWRECEERESEKNQRSVVPVMESTAKKNVCIFLFFFLFISLLRSVFDMPKVWQGCQLHQCLLLRIVHVFFFIGVEKSLSHHNIDDDDDTIRQLRKKHSFLSSVFLSHSQPSAGGKKYV